MKHSLKLLVLAALAGVVVVGCSADSGGESDEESGTQYGLEETYDETRAGARLILDYDAGSNSFAGTVENTIGGILESVRVEVHLSNGVELGPTTPTDIPSGGVIDVTLPATDQSFDTFSAHPEVGGLESGEGGEHDNESGEEGSEHDG